MLDFHPHPLLPSGHLQTLAGFLLFRESFVEHAVQHVVELDDGDRIVLHDDCPPEWQPGDRAALMIHGLAGCHASPYMQRIAGKLNARGARTFRMDLRGCGAGLGLARWPYHSGRSADAAAALRRIVDFCPNSPVALIGFSLGGNIALKLAGEAAGALPTNVDRIVALSPPIDLAACTEQLRQGAARLYDRYFVRLCLQQIAARCACVPEAVLPEGWLAVRSPAVPKRPGSFGAAAPRGMAEFDAAFTAPVCGFGTAENYYRECSSAQFLPEIRVRTLILAAADDPLLPVRPFQESRFSATTTVQHTRHGGHLGFLSRRGAVPDGRWMDLRVVNWVTER